MTSTTTPDATSISDALEAPGAWVVGRNFAGYLPESNTEAYADRHDAVVALIALAEQYANADDEATDLEVWQSYPHVDNVEDVPDDEWGTMRATVDAILADDGPDTPDMVGKDWSMTVADNDGQFVAFWVQWEPTATPNNGNDS